MRVVRGSLLVRPGPSLKSSARPEQKVLLDHREPSFSANTAGVREAPLGYFGPTGPYGTLFIRKNAKLLVGVCRPGRQTPARRNATA